MNEQHRERRTTRLGIIAGSGLQQMTGLTDIEVTGFETAFGEPSSPLTLGLLDGTPVAFLQRHGVGHTIPPASINVRANIAALRQAGCTQILSLSAVGSLDADVAPGHFVLIDQFIDRTVHRDKTFFGTGLVGHVPFGDPVCARMLDALETSAKAAEARAHKGGTYVVIEGPQFSTRAESRLYRQWGATVVGMTAMPEAKLAREAQLCYAMVAIATDFDCWHDQHDAVNVALVSERMARVGDTARRLVGQAAKQLGPHRGPCRCGCDRALEAAVMTSAAHRDARMAVRLESLTAGTFQFPAHEEGV